MTSRFDLEQQIMGCWNLVDDLDYILDDNANDATMNIVLGLKTLYQKKFEKLFSTFEDCIANKQI